MVAYSCVLLTAYGLLWCSFGVLLVLHTVVAQLLIQVPDRYDPELALATKALAAKGRGTLRFCHGTASSGRKCLRLCVGVLYIYVDLPHPSQIKMATAPRLVDEENCMS